MVELQRQPIVKQRPWLLAGLGLVFMIAIVAVYSYVKYRAGARIRTDPSRPPAVESGPGANFYKNHSEPLEKNLPLYHLPFESRNLTASL